MISLTQIKRFIQEDKPDDLHNYLKVQGDTDFAKETYVRQALKEMYIDEEEYPYWLNGVNDLTGVMK